MTVYILFIIAAVAAVYFGIRCISIKNGIRKTNAELNEITRQLEENRIVKLNSPDKDLEKLLVTINALLKQIRQTAINYKLSEKALKKEVEGISHDLRTPLTAILGYLRLIDTEKLSEDDKPSIEIIRQKTFALQRLITQFYDLSRLGGDDYPLLIENTDLSRLLREFLAAHYAVLSGGNLDVTVTIPDEPVFVTADKNAAERILNNLLHNAEKFAGTILDISLTTDVQNAVITFENDIKNTPGDTCAAAENTGLGLKISGILAEKMNGGLRAEAKMRGSVRWFKVTLCFPISST